MLQVSATNPQTFKAQNVQNPYQIASYPRIAPMNADTYQSMALAKKEKSKEKWQKAGIIAQIGLAAAFGIMAFTGLAKFFGGGKLNKAMIKATNAQEKYFNSMLKPNNKEVSEEAVKKLEEQFVDLSNRSDIVGIDDLSLTESFRKWAKGVVTGANAPKDLADLFGESSSNMIFMYGGSGVGKTYNADVILKALGAQRIKKQFSNFSSKYIGETAVEITKFFNELERILQKNPDKRYGVVFDEFETLANNIKNLGEGKEHLKENRTAILNGLDQVRKYKNFYMISSSNVPISQIDEAIARRIGTNIEIDYPTTKALLASLKTQLKRFGIIKDDFFTSNEHQIQAFLDNVYSRKGGHGDIENVVNAAINKSKTKFMDRCIKEGAMDANYKVIDKAKYTQLRDQCKFDVSDLEEALKDIGKLAGERS